ncbi:MAG: hypothetical protein QXS85_02890 [Acidilobaceae archaeon]
MSSICSALVLESSVEAVLSNIYGLEVVTLPGWMIYTHYEVSGTRVLLGGDGFIASIDLEKARVERPLAVVGRVTSLSLDSSDTSYAAVGSDSGEVLVLQLSEWSLLARFYTATRASVKAAYVVKLGSERARDPFPRLIVLDEAGFLYVSRVSRGLLTGWFEAGPVENQGAVTGVYGFRVLSVAPLMELAGWHSYRYLGDRVIALTDIRMPELPANSPFLGSSIIRVYYPDPYRGLIEAYTGVFEPTVLGGPLEERFLYYAVSWGRYLLPLPQPRVSATSLVYYGSNGTVVLENLPPDVYRVRVLYEIVYRDSETRAVLSREYYVGELAIAIKSSSIELVNMTLARSDCSDIVERCLLGGEKLYSPSVMQGLLVLDTRRLPLLFDYEEDGRLVLLPISRQLAELGVRDLSQHTLAVFLKPLDPPLGWRTLNVSYAAVLGLGDWLVVYYLEEGFRLADIGYEQPQLIYLGSRPRAITVSADARTILVGTDRGLFFKIRWLRGLGLAQPAGSLDRYVIDSVLSIGPAAVTSIRMIDETRALVALENGRLQLVDINTWTPLWRGPPGYEGLDTGLRGALVDLAGSYVIAVSPGSNRVYVFRERLDALRPLLVNLVVVTYDDEGRWYVFEPPFELELELRDRATDSVVAVARARRVALFYVPTGSYYLTVSAPGAARPASIAVAVGAEPVSLNLLAIYYPGFPLKVEIIDATRTIEEVMKYHPPRATITLRFLSIDRDVVQEPLRVTLLGPTSVPNILVTNGVLIVSDVLPGEYTVHVSPLTPMLREAMFTVRVSMTRTSPDTLMLYPTSLPVRIILWDVDARASVGVAHRVLLERLGAGSPLLAYPRSLTVAREALVELPAGVYKVRVEPLTLNVYERPGEITVEVREPTTVTINMTRKRFTLELTILDSWGRLMEGARVEFAGIDIPVYVEAKTWRDGRVLVELPYGFYDVTISKRFYKTFTDSIALESSTSRQIIVEPGVVAVLIRYAPILAGVTALAVAGAVFLRVRKMIAERLEEEEL